MVDDACTWCGQAPCACGVEPAVDLDIGLTALDPFTNVPDAARRVDQVATRRVNAPFELVQATVQSRRFPVSAQPSQEALAAFDDDDDDLELELDDGADPFDATDNFSMEALFGGIGDALVLGDPTNIVESVKLTMRHVGIDLDLDEDDLADSDEGAPAGTVEKQLFIGADVERLLTPLVILERRPTAGDLSILSPFERFVLEQIDGKRTVHDLQHAMSLSEGDLRIAVALLADKQLVQLAPLPATTTAATPMTAATPPTASIERAPVTTTAPAPVTIETSTAATPTATTTTTLAMLLARASRAEDGHDLEGAVAALREAITLEPLSAVAHNRLGVLLARVRDIAGAIEALDRALALRPDDPTIRSNHQKIASIAERQQTERRKPPLRRR